MPRLSALVVTLFLGGYTLPFITDGTLRLSGWALALVQILVFSVKTFLVGCFQIQIRWTLPRFRYDQLMAFGWKFLLPLALVNLIVTVCLRWAMS